MNCAERENRSKEDQGFNCSCVCQTLQLLPNDVVASDPA